eukprot:SAG22_NODE_1056_length_5777_cov_137.240402_5_plen_442_part_00
MHVLVPSACAYFPCLTCSLLPLATACCSLRLTALPPAAVICPCSSSLWSPLLVHRVGPKPCILASFAMYATFIAANMYPRWWTLYPGALMVGLAASPLWVSQGILITHYAQVYARSRGEEDASAHVGYFNGIFQSLLVLTGVAGNLVSSIVFSAGSSGAVGTVVSQSTVFFLFAIYLGSAAIAIVIAACTLPSTAAVAAERAHWDLIVPGAEKTPTVWTTLGMLRQRRMLLVAPIFAAMGMLYAFISANFTKNVIQPALGERNVGFVMCAMYLASAVVSVSVGRVSDIVGRPAVLIFAAVCIFSMLGILKYRAPTDATAIYALAVTIGTGMQTLRTPLAAQMSANYRDDIEAAFAATEMVCSVVGAVGYLLAAAISEDDKLNLAAVLCVIGFGCYFVEVFESPAPSPKRPPSVAAGAGMLDSFFFNGRERRPAKMKGGGVQ